MQNTGGSFTFEAFAKTEEYRNVNTEIIRRWLELLQNSGSSELYWLLDVAAGTGLMSEIFLENLPENWPKPAVMFLDKSRDALDLAAKKFVKILPHYSTALASIESITFPPRIRFDVVLWGNAIHYLTRADQALCIKKICEALKPQGWLFFNTAFYSGARPDNTLPFYRAQVSKAVRVLSEKGLRRENRGKKSEAANFLSKKYYEALVADNGFELVENAEFEARLDQDGWEAISSFDEYVIGALPGYPLANDERTFGFGSQENLALAREAMKNAVSPALNDWGLTSEETGKLYVPRNWLSIAARKPA